MKVQYQLDSGNWTELEFPVLRIAKSGCVSYHVQPYVIPEGSKSVSFRPAAPEQKVKPTRKKDAKRINVTETTGEVYGPYSDVRNPKSGDTRINDFTEFRDAYGTSVATVICQDRYRGSSSQGSAVAVPVTLSPESQQYGSTYFATGKPSLSYIKVLPIRAESGGAATSTHTTLHQSLRLHRSPRPELPWMQHRSLEMLQSRSVLRVASVEP